MTVQDNAAKPFSCAKSHLIWLAIACSLSAPCRAPGHLMGGFSLPATPSKAKPRRGVCSLTTLLVGFALLLGESCMPVMERWPLHATAAAAAGGAAGSPATCLLVTTLLCSPHRCHHVQSGAGWWRQPHRDILPQGPCSQDVFWQ